MEKLIKLIKCFLFMMIIFYSSCKHIPETNGKYDYYNLENNSSLSDGLNIVDRDSFIINVDFEKVINSMQGGFFIKDDMLCFADRGIMNVIVYDTLGQYQYKATQKGRGPNEIINLFVASTNIKGDVIILDGNWNLYKYDSTWTKRRFFHIDFNKSYRSFKERMKNPNPNFQDMYEVGYDRCSVRLYKEDYAIFPITIEHPDYNAYQGGNIEQFFENSYVLGMMNMSDSTMGMMCHYSPWYYENEAAGFVGVNFDVNDDLLYMSFDADSLIYKMNILTRKMICSFGVSGNEMNQNYETYSDFEHMEENWLKDKGLYGCYGDLRYESQTGLLYRYYYQGGDRPYGFIQVYDNMVMIGEVQVPKDTYYIGYINGYSYFTSSIPDVDNERFNIYRFKFNRIQLH